MKKITQTKFILLFILAFVTTTILSAQCPPGQVLIESQQDIDDFGATYPNCTQLIDSLFMFGQDITNLNGLSQLEIIQGTFTIQGSLGIIDLSGLESITSLEQLRIDNTNLASLDGLNNLINLSSLVIINNPNLTNIISLSNVTTPLEHMNFINNDNLQSFSGLDNIESMTGNFFIDNNDSLLDLSGLEGLFTVGNSILITNNTNLTSLEGLNSLQNVDGSFKLSGNTNLATVNGLDNLMTIGGSFNISSNPNLTSIVNLQSLNSIGGNLFFSDSQVTSLIGLEKLTQIDGVLNIDNHQNLTDISGISNIHATLITTLQLFNNSSLSTCSIESICNFIDINVERAAIANNSPGCNSREEVEAACLLGTKDVFAQQLTLYPNPAQSKIFISEIEEDTTILIYDGLGRFIKSENYTASGIDVSDLVQGLYFMEARNNGKATIAQFVKE